MSEADHEGFGECRVRPKRRQDRCLRINPNSGWPGSDGVAVVGFGEKGSLRKKFTPAGGVQNDQMIIDSAAEEAEPADLDLVDRCGQAALFEQHLASGKIAHDATGLK